MHHNSKAIAERKRLEQDFHATRGSVKLDQNIVKSNLLEQRRGELDRKVETASN